MDKLSKLAFLTIFIIPFGLGLIFAWILIGNKLVQSQVVFGYLNGISIMVIPTLLAITLGLTIRYMFFRKNK